MYWYSIVIVNPHSISYSNWYPSWSFTLLFCFGFPIPSWFGSPLSILTKRLWWFCQRSSWRLRLLFSLYLLLRWFRSINLPWWVVHFHYLQFLWLLISFEYWILNQSRSESCYHLWACLGGPLGMERVSHPSSWNYQLSSPSIQYLDMYSACLESVDSLSSQLDWRHQMAIQLDLPNHFVLVVWSLSFEWYPWWLKCSDAPTRYPDLVLDVAATFWISNLSAAVSTPKAFLISGFLWYSSVDLILHLLQISEY